MLPCRSLIKLPFWRNIAADCSPQWSATRTWARKPVAVHCCAVFLVNLFHVLANFICRTSIDGYLSKKRDNIWGCVWRSINFATYKKHMGFCWSIFYRPWNHVWSLNLRVAWKTSLLLTGRASNEFLMHYSSSYRNCYVVATTKSARLLSLTCTHACTTCTSAREFVYWNI